MTAQDAYAAAHAECLELLAELTERTEDADAPSDATHWGHVGSMQHLAAQLREIINPE